MDTDFSNIDGKYFNRWSLSACKHCNALKFNGLNLTVWLENVKISLVKILLYGIPYKQKY